MFSLDGDGQTQAMQPLYVDWEFQVVSKKRTQFGRFSVTMRYTKTGLLKVQLTYVAQTTVEMTAHHTLCCPLLPGGSGITREFV
jgi:hypothetical protein